MRHDFAGSYGLLAETFIRSQFARIGEPLCQFKPASGASAVTPAKEGKRMDLRTQKRSGNSGLLSRLSLPIFALIVTFIALFATASSYILIRVQNDHTLKMSEQSMKFVYRNM
jgi:hypothetical protein